MSPAHRLKLRHSKKASKTKSSAKAIFIKIVFVVCFVFFVLASWNLYKSWKNSHWISGTRITVVIAATSPKIYSYNPQTENLILLTVPENTQINASRGYGSWLAGSLWKLGEQENLGGGLLAESLQKDLGLPIDAWVEEKGEYLFANRKLGFISASFEALTSGNIQTNLTFFDRLHLLLSVGGLGAGGRREFDLEASGVVKKQKLTDGTDGYVVVPEKTKVSFEILRDDLIFAEAKKLKIFNTTEKPGLAQDVTRVATTLGLRVIGAATNTEKVKNCEVRGDKTQISSLAAKRLIAVLKCSLSQNDSGGPEDLELWLGEEFAKKF